MAYWFNITTKQVQTDADRSSSDDVMGPYDTEDEARNALATAAQNTEQWDAEDRAWESGSTGTGTGTGTGSGSGTGTGTGELEDQGD
jgi:hypothetical protein